MTPDKVTRASIDVFIANGFDDALVPTAAALRRFVFAGGGLVMGGQAWSAEPGVDAQSLPFNQVLIPLGLEVSREYADEVDACCSGCSAADVAAAAAVEAQFLKRASQPASDDELTALIDTLRETAAWAPFDAASPFWKKIDRVRHAGRTPAVATAGGQGAVPGPALHASHAASPCAAPPMPLQWIALHPGIDYQNPVPRRSAAALAALGRALKYTFVPIGQLFAASDAAKFPGLPPAGTKPNPAFVPRQACGPLSCGGRDGRACGRKVHL